MTTTLHATPTLDALLTLDEAAEYLRTTPRHLADLARGRLIGALKSGRQWVFPATKLAAYVEANTLEAAADVTGSTAQAAEHNPWGRTTGSLRRSRAAA